MSWTDERVTLLKKMWCEGRTAADIARELGDVTRNAVIGKAHRLKLSNRVSPIQQDNKKSAAPAAPVREKPVAIVRAVIPETRIKGKGVKMTELRDRMCRWPSGDPREADFHFCGCASVPGLPYCADHAKVAYQAASRSRTLQASDFEDHGVAVVDEDAKEASGN